ncbi:MAG: hypothetical protein OXG27_14655 [Chloroflexi bacterium]|nr:hypothetical protein [Chloroflexota bacterium]
MSRLWSFDLDGVLAEPPFGWNPAINRNVSLEPAADTVLPSVPNLTMIDRLLTATWYRVRYVLRPPRPGALDAVRCASERGRVIVLTGRHERGRRQTQAWLIRYGFAELVDELVMNASALASARYKEAYLRGSGATLHVDDDAATVALLARNGVRSGLVEWPRNRSLTYPPGVTRCVDLREVQDLIRELSADD